MEGGTEREREREREREVSDSEKEMGLQPASKPFDTESSSSGLPVIHFSIHDCQRIA